MTQLFVIVDVGCIECDEPTTVIGVFEDGVEAAAAFAAEIESKGASGDGSYFSQGQHRIELHPVPVRSSVGE